MNRDPLIWSQSAAVAAAYAACYELTRDISFSHWMLPAGLRLACLLLVPRRFWPALVVGEALPIAEMSVVHAADLGTLWAVLTSIPPLLACIPAVMWLQSRTSLRGASGEINMSMILAATLLCATAVATMNSVAFSALSMGDGSVPPPLTPALFLAWVLGCYLGAVALTPTIIALRDRVVATHRGFDWRATLRSPLARDLVVFALPSLGALILLADHVTGDTLQVVRMAMALPVVALTWRHGWHGASFSGLFASVALASTAFTLQDPSMIRAQVVLALAISTSLMLGVRVARRDTASHSLPVHIAQPGLPPN